MPTGINGIRETWVPDKLEETKCHQIILLELDAKFLLVTENVNVELSTASEFNLKISKTIREAKKWLNDSSKLGGAVQFRPI